jgi:acylphosphatase
VSELVQAHVFVSGRVQGVGYRINTERQARQLHLQGWVRNLRDGRVEAVFEGTASDVTQMIAWCRQGPISASVKEVEVVYNPPQGHAGFEIKR